MGLQLAAGVLVFYFIGRWADGQCHTSPWLMLAGVMMGVVGGLIKFVKSVNELTKKQSSNNQDERP